MADPRGLLVVPVGFRSDGSIHALELDTSDRLKVLVDAVTGMVTVQQTDPSKLTAGLYAWDGSAFQKLTVDSSSRLKVLVDAVTSPIIIDGASPSLLRPSPKSSQFSNLTLPAGSSQQVAVTVPAGEYWRLTNVSVVYVGTVAGVTLTLYINTTTKSPTFAFYNGITSGFPYLAQVNCLLGPGWSVGCIVGGATLNDDLYVNYLAERVY